MSLDLEQSKRRLITMIVVDGVCMLVAVAAGIGAFAYGIEALQWLFAGAVVAGFGAQIWFMAGLRRSTDTEA